MPNLENLIGKTFHELTVVEKVSGRKRRPYRCECSCGLSVFKDRFDLESGRYKTCGHGQGKPGDHNLSHTAEFHAWTSMKQRCTNPKTNTYKHYGGKGIGFSPEWADFKNFIRDMGFRPGPEYSLDRIDGTKSYSKSNCRWATDEVQNTNRSITVWIEANGRRLTLAQWSREVGINQQTIAARLKRGWLPQHAVMTPVARINKSKAAIKFQTQRSA